MIATIAERAICLPKLEETLVIWRLCASKRDWRSWSSLFWFADDRDFIRVWKFSYLSEPKVLPRPWMTAYDWPMSFAWLRTEVSDTGCGVLNVTWVPPLKSVHRLSPLTPSEPTPIDMIPP